MCGIVGYTGKRAAVDVLLKGLKRLEYRGYDSAGVAYFLENKIQICKSDGKIANVEKLLDQKTSGQITSHCGIGHTRWATHGRPTTQNAHPHQTGHVVIVHNGIIENYLEIREDLVSRGHKPASETDSELFGFLVLEEMEKDKSLLQAVRESFLKIRGSCSFVVMSEREPGVLIGIRSGTPLVAARDPKGGILLASDPQPLLEYTHDVFFLEDGDLVQATPHEIRFFHLQQETPIERKLTHLDWSATQMDKQGYDHYMQKEIFEQPIAIVDTLNGTLDRTKAQHFQLSDQPSVDLLKKAEELLLVACGTSYHAALVGKYWFERIARIPTRVELASELRYATPSFSKKTLLIALSQSGETADTLAIVREMKKLEIPTLAITNVRGSTLSRETDAVMYTFAGPEIGVAASKTFTTQLLLLLLLAGSLRKNQFQDLFHELLKLPHQMSELLTPDSAFHSQIRSLAREFANSKGFFFIGRGTSYPLALEGALKLKEIAYVHAEGYAAGELKHGPIAMIDKDMTVVVLAPQDHWRDKTMSNLEEVKARSARVIGIGTHGDARLMHLCDGWIELPLMNELSNEHLSPFLLALSVQLLSYELAILKGTNVDQPRNLAKSVTVE